MMNLNYLNAILADAAPAAPAAAPAGATEPPPNLLDALFRGPFVLIIAMVVMMYFLMIRPQSQQRKKLAAMLETLRSGDKVVTTSGIVGIVISVKDKTVSLRSADAKMEMTKSSVVEILERGGDEKPAS